LAVLATRSCVSSLGAHDIRQALGLDPVTFLAITKPYAERRTPITARRWPHRAVAVTSEQVTFDGYLDGDIPADNYPAARQPSVAGVTVFC
jgi:hypothetical protein